MDDGFQRKKITNQNPLSNHDKLQLLIACIRPSFSVSCNVTFVEGNSKSDCTGVEVALLGLLDAAEFGADPKLPTRRKGASGASATSLVERRYVPAVGGRLGIGIDEVTLPERRRADCGRCGPGAPCCARSGEQLAERT